MKNINLSNGLQKFIDICIKTLDKFAPPPQKKYSRGNNMSFMNKSLCRAHMKRTRLRNCYLKKRCVSLLRKTKKILLCKLECKRYCR